ncbi:phosphatase PAP2 family protein, partial [Symbiobacterium thermophilum]
WGAIADHVRRRWFTWAAGILVFLIGFSRLYIGVHWPLDVIGGWAIGLVVLWLMVRSRRFWTGEGQSLGLQALLAFLLPGAALGLLALLGPVDEIAWMVMGTWSGLLLGSALEEQWVRFDPRAGTPLQHLLKIIVGIVLVLAAKEGLKLVLPDSGVGDMVRYGLVAFTATLVAPWLFARFIARPPAVQLEQKTHHL